MFRYVNVVCHMPCCIDAARHLFIQCDPAWSVTIDELLGFPSERKFVFGSPQSSKHISKHKPQTTIAYSICTYDAFRAQSPQRSGANLQQLRQLPRR